MKKNIGCTLAPKWKRILTVCLVLALVAGSNLAVGHMAWNRATLQAQEELEKEKEAFFSQYLLSCSDAYQRLTDSWTRSLGALEADVVFLGDSITAGGAWEEYYPYFTTVNLGVVGDTTDEVLVRLKQVEILNPQKCFLLIGVNDLIAGKTQEDILENYAQILERLSAQSQETGMQVCVQSVLPVQEAALQNVSNQQIRLLNEGIQALADAYGASYVDVHTHMAGEDGMLQEQYSYDGLHISELAYWEWQEILLSYIDE